MKSLITTLRVTLLVTPPLLFFFLCAVEPLTEAREMQGRLGLGYNSEFSNLSSGTSQKLPGVSIKYGLTRDIAIEGILAVQTTNPGNSVTAVKFFKNLFYEQNLNFYFMIGGGTISPTTSSGTGAEFIGGFGAEFFIPGIESLGFSVETGATFDNTSGTFVLRTLGVGFLDAGIHFYF